MILDIIGQIFWFGILFTPLASYFIVKRTGIMSITGKILTGILIVLILAFMFFMISMEIVLRVDGLGPP